MALKIKKTDARGIIVSYHRIREVTLVDEMARVTIASYYSSTYRNTEKKARADMIERNKLIELIAAELEKEELQRDTESIIAWTEQANALVPENQEINFVIAEESHDLTFDKCKPTSFTDLYTQLKTLPEFVDATDV